MQEKPFVLTLIAPAGTILNAAELVSKLPVSGGPVWLNDCNRYASESTAMDVFLLREPDALMLQEVAAFCAANKIDYVLQPTTHREKKLLISDMDSTMIQNECIDEMARVMGKYDEVKAITASTMGNVASDFSTSLRTRLGMIPGVTVQQMQHIFDNVIKPMPGAKTLIATMKDRGATTHLVSGGFTFFSEKVAAMLGFDTHDSNLLEIKDGAITGHVLGDIVDKDKKKALLLQYAAQHNVPLAATLAVGDGSNDVPMLQVSGLGIAYHASEGVRAKAHASITHNDLTALLYAQGIARDKWV